MLGINTEHQDADENELIEGLLFLNEEIKPVRDKAQRQT
jgi:hypothetical protein